MCVVGILSEIILSMCVQIEYSQVWKALTKKPSSTDKF